MDTPLISDLVERVGRLERENRRLKGAGFVALIGVALLMTGRDRGPAKGAPPTGQEAAETGGVRGLDPAAAYEAQAALARRALEISGLATARGIPARDQPDLEYRWSLRALGARIYLSLPPDGPRTDDPRVYLSLTGVKPDLARRAAFEAHWRLTRRWEEALRGVARRGGLSDLDLANAEYRRLQAEAWLAWEDLKARGSEPRPAR